MGQVFPINREGRLGKGKIKDLVIGKARSKLRDRNPPQPKISRINTEKMLTELEEIGLESQQPYATIQFHDQEVAYSSNPLTQTCIPVGFGGGFVGCTIT